METKNKLSIGYFQAAGFLALMPAFCFWILWVLLQPLSEKLTSAERIELYLLYFPDIMKDTHLIFIIAAVTISISVLLSIWNIRFVNKAFKVLGVMTILLGALLFIFELTTMF